MVSRPNLAEDSTLYAIAQKLDEPRAYSVINHCAAEQWHPRLTFTVFWQTTQLNNVFSSQAESLFWQKAQFSFRKTVRLPRGSVLAKCNGETIFCGHYRFHCDVIGLHSYRIHISEITQNRGYYVQGHQSNRKPVCDFPLVINTRPNWHPISYRLEVIADYCLNLGHFAFWAPLWRRRPRGNVHCSS